MNYIKELVIPELQEAELDNLPMLKATCLRMVLCFRNQLPDQDLINYLDVCHRFIDSDQKVNHSYAGHCVEKLLLKCKKGTKEPILNKSNIS